MKLNTIISFLPTNLDNLPSRLQMFIMGMLASFGFAPLGFFVLFLLSAGFLEASVIKFHHQRYRLIFDYGFFWGLGYYMLNLYWVNVALLVEPERYFWLLPLSSVLIPALLSIFIGLVTCSFVWILKKLDRNRTIQQWRQDERQVWYYFLVITIFSFLWIAGDLLRSSRWIFGGFPWNLAGYIWWFSDALLQICAVIGIYGLTFLTIFMSSFTAVLWLKRHKHHLDYAFIFLPIALILSLGLAFGYLRLAGSNSKAPTLELNIRLLQNNIPQRDKMTTSNPQLLLKVIMRNAFGQPRSSSNIASDFQPDLIVGGENILFTLFDHDTDIQQEISSRLHRMDGTDLAKTHFIFGTTTGSITQEGDWKLYNSIALMNSQNVLGIYQKNLLVPFGEYIPLSKWFSFLNTISGTINLQAGTEQNLLPFKPGVDILPLVCYEAIFTSYPYKFLAQASQPENFKIMVNVTNDSWFGLTSGPFQHLQIARVRSIETGLPMIRVSDTGISAIISAKGEIIYRTKLGQAKISDKKIIFTNLNTFYKWLMLP